jgi:hypothetical protein
MFMFKFRFEFGFCLSRGRKIERLGWNLELDSTLGLNLGLDMTMVLILTFCSCAGWPTLRTDPPCERERARLGVPYCRGAVRIHGPAEGYGHCTFGLFSSFSSLFVCAIFLRYIAFVVGLGSSRSLIICLITYRLISCYAHFYMCFSTSLSITFYDLFCCILFSSPPVQTTSSSLHSTRDPN